MKEKGIKKEKEKEKEKDILNAMPLCKHSTRTQPISHSFSPPRSGHDACPSSPGAPIIPAAAKFAAMSKCTATASQLKKGEGCMEKRERKREDDQSEFVVAK